MTSTHSSGKTSIEKQQSAKITSTSLIIISAYIGICFIEPHAQLFLCYIQLTSIAYAMISFWLCWFLYKKNDQPISTTLCHQFLHWCATLLALYIITIFISNGVLSTHEACFMSMIIIAFSFFIAGIYTETLFLLVGTNFAAITCIITGSHNHKILFISGISTACIIAIVYLSRYQKLQPLKASHEKNKK